MTARKRLDPAVSPAVNPAVRALPKLSVAMAAAQEAALQELCERAEQLAAKEAFPAECRPAVL